MPASENPTKKTAASRLSGGSYNDKKKETRSPELINIVYMNS